MPMLTQEKEQGRGKCLESKVNYWQKKKISFPILLRSIYPMSVELLF